MVPLGGYSMVVGLEYGRSRPERPAATPVWKAWNLIQAAKPLIPG